MTYFEEATRLWPNAKILGQGRYAVSALNGAVVYLATTEQQAHNIGLGIENPVYEDLAPKPMAKRFSNIRDNDADDRRRERHEKRVQEQRLNG